MKYSPILFIKLKKKFKIIHGDIFLKPNFMFLPHFYSTIPLRIIFFLEQNLIFNLILQYFYYFIFTILPSQFMFMLFIIIYSIILGMKLSILLHLGENLEISNVCGLASYEYKHVEYLFWN